MATTNSTIEKIAPMFTDLLIKKIECLKTDWQKPWIASLGQGLPRNIRGTLYNGGNVLMLLFYTEFMKFTLPVFLTFNQAKEEDLSVCKGARSFPVYYWFKFVVHRNEKDNQVRGIPQAARNRAGKLQGYPADEVLQCLQHRPDRFCRKAARTLRAHEEGGATRRLFGRNDLRGVGRACLSANWYCPIKVQYSDSAYYSPSSDHIICPQREQFPQERNITARSCTRWRTAREAPNG